jgi:hypothetical protein
MAAPIPGGSAVRSGPERSTDYSAGAFRIFRRTLYVPCGAAG